MRLFKVLFKQITELDENHFIEKWIDDTYKFDNIYSPVKLLVGSDVPDPEIEFEKKLFDEIAKNNKETFL